MFVPGLMVRSFNCGLVGLLIPIGCVFVNSNQQGLRRTSLTFILHSRLTGLYVYESSLNDAVTTPSLKWFRYVIQAVSRIFTGRITVRTGLGKIDTSH